jgi:hypothetical protein
MLERRRTGLLSSPTLDDSSRWLDGSELVIDCLDAGLKPRRPDLDLLDLSDFVVLEGDRIGST